MAFRTYQETRPWAKAIRQAVMTHNMPPWYADTTIDHFKNDRHLTEQEVATITKWVDDGALEGKKSRSAEAAGVHGRVGDRQARSHREPAEGVHDSGYGRRAVSIFHHRSWLHGRHLDSGGRSTADAARAGASHPGVRAGRGGSGRETAAQSPRRRAVQRYGDRLRAGRAEPTWDKDTAFLVKAGSTFLLQVHYTTNGKEAIDKSVVGLKIRKDKPTYRAVSGSATQFKLDIPPGDPSYETKATYTFREDTTLLDLTPHMHLRGKAFKYVLTYPDGRSEVLLDVPHYDFNWQLAYILAEPRKVPAGSRMDVTAWYDNSPNNKYNPDPTQTVHWGDQTFQEMMIGFFNYKVPVDRPDPPKAERPTRGAAQ